MNDTLAEWHLLILALPAAAKTVRMRLWRTLKAAGAAVLRDGVYLLPASAAAQTTLHALAEAAEAAGGKAHVWRMTLDDSQEDNRLRHLFDRDSEYAGLLEAIRATRGRPDDDPARTMRRVRQLQRDLAAIEAIDFFPSASRSQARSALTALEHECMNLLEPGEPRTVEGRIRKLKRSDYQRRQWATRRHLWVDRAASAWLIRRFIDPKARFVWLDDVKRCPPRANGFDYDGAAFTHVDARVTFEVLLASFDLEKDPALLRLGALVHHLDVGGVPVAEAPGLESILRGARVAHPDDDDALLAAVSPALDCLYLAYQQEDTSR